MSGYLFVHFIGEQKDGEQIYFAVSRDGLHWQDLNGCRPVLRSHIGEKGVRDPFCVRDDSSGRFYLMATDLRMESGKSWEEVKRTGSRNLIIWESEDLIHWSKERSVTVGIEGAGCVWAPEAVYIGEKNSFLVFWASRVREPGETEGKQRIYSAFTRDFREFTPARKYMEKDCHVIDTTMIEAEGKYYRFSKDETTKRIYMECGETWEPNNFHTIHSQVLESLYGVEGPEIYQLLDGSYCLLVDQFAAGKGYLPLISKDLKHGVFELLPEESYNMGRLKKRHGGVLAITDDEYENLFKYFGTFDSGMRS